MYGRLHSVKCGQHYDEKARKITAKNLATKYTEVYSNLSRMQLIATTHALQIYAGPTVENRKPDRVLSQESALGQKEGNDDQEIKYRLCSIVRGSFSFFNSRIFTDITEQEFCQH